MNAELHYITGEEIHAGDRVQNGLTYGTVVFVSDGSNEECVPGYAEYTGSERGLMFCDDDGATEFIGELNENLSFIDRG
ncbi:MAG TPA: hypothetical protein VN673_15185 [Clostridia bacterium]|nr:hypothetical protein [Clostridia bacterium]